MARGDFIALHSSDDLWIPEKLQLQMNVLLDQPSTEFIVGIAEFFLEPGATVSNGFRLELLDAPRPAYIAETLLPARDSLRK